MKLAIKKSQRVEAHNSGQKSSFFSGDGKASPDRPSTPPPEKSEFLFTRRM
jgi:hypothetical protein